MPPVIFPKIDSTILCDFIKNPETIVLTEGKMELILSRRKKNRDLLEI